MVASSQINRNIVKDRNGKDHVITEERLVDITDNSAVKDLWNGRLIYYDQIRISFQLARTWNRKVTISYC